MIRPMTDDDVPAVGRIWLEASLLAHDFVPAEFWRADHELMVSEVLPGSFGFVHEADGEIDGFVVLGSGPRAHVMGALFVSPSRQGQGIGAQLVDQVKGLRDPLETSVYQQNERAFGFYKAWGFVVTGEAVCEHTGCKEHVLRWTATP